MTDTRSPAESGPDRNGHLKVDVTVYFPAHEQRFPVQEPDVIYLRTSGAWLRYERSGSCLEADTTEEFNGANGSVHESVPESSSLHWAGYHSGSEQELIRERRPRVYYDPHKHPDQFVTENGGPPTAPLPALELNCHLEDPEPWLDPTSGTRFTCEQARTATAILRYVPRKDQTTSRDGEGPQNVRPERRDTFTQSTAPTSPPPEQLQGAHEEVSFSR